MSLEKLKKEILNEKTFSVALLIIAIVAILSFIFGLITFNNEILFLTFLALLWYARETQKMKETMREQLKLEGPVVDLFYRPVTANHKNCFRLKNTGRAIAYNIKVKTIIFDGETFEFSFDDPNLLLVPNEEKSLLVRENHKEYKDGAESIIGAGDGAGELLRLIKNKTKKSKDKHGYEKLEHLPKVNFYISYENISGQKQNRKFVLFDKGLNSDVQIKLDFGN